MRVAPRIALLDAAKFMCLMGIASLLAGCGNDSNASEPENGCEIKDHGLSTPAMPPGVLLQSIHNDREGDARSGTRFYADGRVQGFSRGNTWSEGRGYEPEAVAALRQLVARLAAASPGRYYHNTYPADDATSHWLQFNDGRQTRHIRMDADCAPQAVREFESAFAAMREGQPRRATEAE